MVTVEIDNSMSQIKGLPSVPFNRLRKILSYSADPQAAFFSGNNFNRLRYCIDKTGAFPTGLLPAVSEFLQKEVISNRLVDSRIKPTHKVDHKPRWDIPPYDFQVKAVDMLEKKHRAIISAPTGSGKSLIIALIVARLSVRTLIVVPKLELKEQLTESLKRIFGDMSNIRVENIDSNALKTAQDYDCLIIDESHHVAAKTYHKLNRSVWRGMYYRAFLTATPFRNQTEETLLFEGIAGRDIFKLSYKEAVLKKYIVPVEAYYIEIPKVKTDTFTWAEVYSQLVVHNETRNQIIAKLLLELTLSGISTLCLVKEIKHGDKLKELTDLPFANGQDESTRQFIEKFNKKEICSLIGTTGILGEGVDSKPCEFVIIAGLGKAKSAFMQQVGRAVRTYPGKETAKVILIMDHSHKYLLRHYREQVKVLKDEYGITPIKLEL